MKVQKRFYSMLLACVMSITSICTLVQASFYEDEGVEVVFDEMDGDETIINDIVESANDDGNYDIIYDHDVDDTYDETWDGSEDIEPDDGQFIIEDFADDAAISVDEEDYYEESIEMDNDMDLVGEQDNHLIAYPAGSEPDESGVYPSGIALTVMPHEEVTLSVVVSADDISSLTYTWFINGILIEGERTTSLEVIEPRTAYYKCNVEDQYGNSVSCIFNVNVENHLNVEPIGFELTKPSTVYPYAFFNEELTLSVKATADDVSDIKYSWYAYDLPGEGYAHIGKDGQIEGATESEYTLIPEKITVYSCYVQDRFGNEKYIQFYVTPRIKGSGFKGACPLKENEEFEFHDAYEYYFTLVPSVSHDYAFYSLNSSDKDFSVQIYDADQKTFSYDWYEPANEETAFARQVYLEAGKRYYFVVRRKSGKGSCRVKIEKSDFSATWGSQDYITMDYSELHSITFSVEAHSSSELSFIWREDGSEEILSTTDSCTFTPTKHGEHYVECYVSDGILQANVYFEYLVTRNHLVAYPKGNKADADGKYSNTREYTPICMEKITLATIATADDTSQLQYKWYKYDRGYVWEDLEMDSGSYKLIKNHSANTLEIFAGEETNYKCEVTDQYGNGVTCYFEIKPEFIQQVEVTSKSKIAVGKSTALKVTGALGNVTYESSNTAVATVTSKGAVKGVKPGTATITVNVGVWSYPNSFKGCGPVSKSIKIAVVPAATTSLTATNLSKGIKLSWKKVTGATGYLIYRNSKLVKTINSGSTVTFTDTAANTNGTKYVYKVVAKASTGNSTLSKSVTTYRISRPAISSVSNSKSKTMTVKWGKNAKATGYQIQYSTSSSFASGNKTATISSNGTVSKAIGSLVKGKTYYVRIRSYKTVSGKKYFSTWSAKKNVKITK